MANSEYVIAENYTLPSHGLVYDRKINPDVKLRSMTVREEMRRMNPSTDGTSYKTLAEIIDNCLIEKPGISAYDLCLGDFQFLMHKLRIVTFGSNYSVSVRCPNCGKITSTEYNLEDLELTELTEFDKNKELFIELPYSKKTIELNITTPRLLDQISLDVDRVEKQMRKAGETCIKDDWNFYFQLVRSIKSVDGIVLNQTEKETFVDKLVGRDYNAIINKLAEIDNKVGLSSTMIITCGNCGFDIDTTFRASGEFFRPKAIG